MKLFIMAMAVCSSIMRAFIVLLNITRVTTARSGVLQRVSRINLREFHSVCRVRYKMKVKIYMKLGNSSVHIS